MHIEETALLKFAFKLLASEMVRATILRSRHLHSGGSRGLSPIINLVDPWEGIMERSLYSAFFFIFQFGQAAATINLDISG